MKSCEIENQSVGLGITLYDSTLMHIDGVMDVVIG